jgi:hypothetical protein
VTEETGKLLGMKVKGKMEVCFDCVMANSNRKGLRVSFDISYLKTSSFGGLQY